MISILLEVLLLLVNQPTVSVSQCNNNNKFFAFSKIRSLYRYGTVLATCLHTVPWFGRAEDWKFPFKGPHCVSRICSNQRAKQSKAYVRIDVVQQQRHHITTSSKDNRLQFYGNSVLLWNSLLVLKLDLFGRARPQLIHNTSLSRCGSRLSPSGPCLICGNYPRAIRNHTSKLFLSLITTKWHVLVCLLLVSRLRSMDMHPFNTCYQLLLHVLANPKIRMWSTNLQQWSN